MTTDKQDEGDNVIITTGKQDEGDNVLFRHSLTETGGHHGRYVRIAGDSMEIRTGHYPLCGVEVMSTTFRTLVVFPSSGKKQALIRNTYSVRPV
jgi:hypothetical protein